MKSGSKQKFKRFSFEAIGTHWYIEYLPDDIAGIEDMVQARIAAFDKVYSRFRSDSLVSQIAQKPGMYRMPDDATVLFDFYDQLYDLTDGLITPLIGNTLSDAGYDASYNLVFNKKTIAPELRAAIMRNGTGIATTQPILIDVGAAGKGYIVDIVCEILRKNQVRSAVVDAGGDLAVYSFDDYEVQIALQHPTELDKAIGVASLSQGSICGSSIYLRNWKTHHHIINPNSAESPKGIQAVWVYAKQAMVADGLSTALFFVSPEQLKDRFDFEYAIMKADDSLVFSSDFPATFFE